MSYFGIKNWNLEVARGNVPNHSIFRRFGENPDIDTTTDPEDVWDAGGTYSFSSSAVAWDISSSSTNDDGSPAGTGARTIRVMGLDSNYDEQQEDITMDGTTAVTTSNSYIRFTRAYVLTVGSVGTNDGNIDIVETATSTTVGYIRAGLGQTLMTIYTVPNAVTAYLMSWNIGVSTGVVTTGATLTLYQRPTGGAWRVVDRTGVETAGTSYVQHVYQTPITLSAKTDVRWEATEVSANDTAVAGGFELILES